ncbi:MAG: hypothetical protein JO025_01665 [Verrucomicrobia bacterium]|nr:hypothetical protein [Verrucomicrobiota bacterium]
MKNVTRLVAVAGASLCLVALAKADEIQFTALPQVVQSSVIKQTRITSPTKVVRVVQDNGIYGVTVMTDTGQQVVYVNPTGTIVESPTVVHETAPTVVQQTGPAVTHETTTTTTTEVPDEVVTTQEIQSAGSRYELIEKKGNKAIYLDHQTGRKVKVEYK